MALFREIVVLGGDAPRVVAAVRGYIHVAEDDHWQRASFDCPPVLQVVDVNGLGKSLDLDSCAVEPEQGLVTTLLVLPEQQALKSDQVSMSVSCVKICEKR